MSAWVRFRRPLRVASALAGLSVTGIAAGAWVLDASTPLDGLARAVLVALVVVCTMPALRDLLALLSLASSDRVAIGDHLRIDTPPLEGRVVAMGLRRTVVRTEASVDVSIPNRRLDAQAIHRIARASERTGVPVELDVPLEAGVDAQALRDRLFEAAMLSAFAVPGQQVDVALVATPSGRASIRLRGWVAHHDLAGRYRGDVLQRLHGEGPTQST